MKTILQMTLATFRPKIEYVGPYQMNGQSAGVCYHVTFRENATEEDIYAAREGVAALGYMTLVYHTGHNGLPQLGVFSKN